MLINVDLYVPLAVSTPTQATSSTRVVDYDFIRRSIARAWRAATHLQETLCDDVLAMMAHPKVRAARVQREARCLPRPQGGRAAKSLR